MLLLILGILLLLFLLGFGFSVHLLWILAVVLFVLLILGAVSGRLP